MNALESKYFPSSKFLMDLIGLWPYQSQRRRWISLIMFYVLVLSAVIPNVNKKFLITLDTKFPIDN